MPNYVSFKKIFNIQIFTTLSVVCLLFIIVVNLVTTNVLSTQGVGVNNSEIETLALEKENQVLSIKIEEESRLKEIEFAAASQGFQRTSNIVFAPTISTVALR